jgi:hypothetical protein
MNKKNTLKKRTYKSKKRCHKNMTKKSIHKKKKNIKKMFGGMFGASSNSSKSDKYWMKDPGVRRLWEYNTLMKPPTLAPPTLAPPTLAPPTLDPPPLPLRLYTKPHISFGSAFPPTMNMRCFTGDSAMSNMKVEEDYTSELPIEIIEESIKRNIFGKGIPDTINSRQLKGHFFHGIKQRVITLMQILEINGIGSQNYISRSGVITPGIMSTYRDNEKEWISFGIMHHSPSMNTYCVNSIFFVNKRPEKAMELNEGKNIGISSHMYFEYYLNNFLSLDGLILCIDSTLADKNISELKSPFDEHRYWFPGGKIEIIKKILTFFNSEFLKLSKDQLIASEADLDMLANNEEEFKRFYISNLLRLVNYIRHHLTPSDKSEITEITIFDFISLLLRYYEKDIQILKVIFER